MALLPLRLFLGGTFVYAGIQKLSDPGFLHKGAPTYIGTQLHAFATHTPGGFLLRAFALPHPALAGIGVAVLEIAIGLLVFSGLLTRWAAAAGMGLNFILFLTASWHTSPFFLGSDIVFVFAWLPFVLVGADDQPALDHVIDRGVSPALARRMQMHPERSPQPAGGPNLTRRALLAQTGAAAVGIAGIAALLKGSYHGPAIAQASHATSTTAGGATSQGTGSAASGQGSASTTASTRSLPANAVKIGPGSRLPSGQAAQFQDPASGQADILIRQTDGSLNAFSAVCTHAGCTVGYQGGQIACPCHGAIFNGRTGAVEGGPAPTGLTPVKVIEQGGNIYALPA